MAKEIVFLAVKCPNNAPEAQSDHLILFTFVYGYHNNMFPEESTR